MQETWNYDLMDLLEDARLDDSKELKYFISKYSPLAATNEDLSVLLLFRHFNVSFWNEERRITNCHPENEDFQSGITIVQLDDDGGTENNFYLPNTLHYNEFKIKEQEIEIITAEKTVTTNLTELNKKLNFFNRNITEQEIENAFNTLSNAQYNQPKKLEVKDKTIKIMSLGELTYNDKLEWYEGKIQLKNKVIDVNVCHAEPHQLEKLLSFVDQQMSAKFFEEVLLKMENKMVTLKNDAWLGEDDETGEDEPPITAEDFRKRISISSIVFYEDCTSLIYCNDDDIFWGHSIEIHVDKNGKYKEANLVG